MDFWCDKASRAMGCTHVLSEDLSDGQDYGGVRVTNPFQPCPRRLGQPEMDVIRGQASL